MWAPSPTPSAWRWRAAKCIYKPETVELIRKGLMKKGDVLSVAQIAGIMAAKKTSELIPLCHPIALNQVEVMLELVDDLPGVQISATARTVGKTGVEMEALTAVSGGRSDRVRYGQGGGKDRAHP